MKIKTLKELSYFTFNELQDIFEVEDPNHLKEIIQSLFENNIIKSLKNISDADLEQLLEIDEIKRSNLPKQTSYSFKYVGMIIVENILLFIYPKYIKNIEKDKQNNYKKFKQIINVIRKYESKQQKIHTTNNTDVESSNMLSICLELLLDYFEHGLYNNHKQIIELNGEGEIFWEKTINENIAYISNNVPVYLDTFNYNQKDNDNDYFKELHSFVLTDISNRFSEVLELIGLEGVDLSLSDINNFGKTEYIVHRLNQEISTQFITYKQNILKLLKKYIQEKESKSTSQNISFLGTNAFNLVWEDVCSVVMNNSLNKTLADLNLKYSKNNNSKLFLKDIIFKPKWKYHSNDNHQNDHHHESKTLIPDIVCIDKNKNSLFIYDAKYYNILLNEKSIKSQPGIGDITKQYLYELAYKEFAKENNLNIVENAFLFPSDENQDIKQEKIGCVVLDELSSILNKQSCGISVILKSCEKMYKEYLRK
ncbi:LlaJI family restriction endonuclease [Mycoplasma yeatsii]|uniref:Uncharacterized protein n=1 Tax=Mycoplasma yeatsii TaxID=51365 RepID=A0ABU0NE87_9MOLU|nr:LlaJI family restriction endonuclease [Mycoplasma yeatsii]MDQ0567728.1 hypothetical protein [Mycoplasma yeatsii]